MSFNANLAARAAAAKRGRSTEPEEAVESSAATFVNLCTLPDLQELLAADPYLRAMMVFASENAILKDEEFVMFAGLEMAKSCVIAGLGLHSLVEDMATPSKRVYKDNAASESDVVDYRGLPFTIGQGAKTASWNYHKHHRPFDIRNVGLSSAAGCKALVDGIGPDNLVPLLIFTISNVVARATVACDTRAAEMPAAETQSFIKSQGVPSRYQWLSKASPPAQYAMLTAAVQAITLPALEARNKLLLRAGAGSTSSSEQPYSTAKFEKIFGLLPSPRQGSAESNSSQGSGLQSSGSALHGHPWDLQSSVSSLGSSLGSHERSFLAGGSGLGHSTASSLGASGFSNASSLGASQVSFTAEQPMSDAEYQAEHDLIVAAQGGEPHPKTDAEFRAEHDACVAAAAIVTASGQVNVSGALQSLPGPVSASGLVRPGASAVVSTAAALPGAPLPTQAAHVSGSAAAASLADCTVSATAATARGQTAAPTSASSLARAAPVPSSAVGVVPSAVTTVAGVKVSVAPAPPPRSATVSIAARPTATVTPQNPPGRQLPPPLSAVTAATTATTGAAHVVAIINPAMNRTVAADPTSVSALAAHTGEPPHRGEVMASQVNQPSTASAEEFDDDAGNGALATHSVPLATASVAAGVPAATSRRFNKGSR